MSELLIRNGLVVNATGSTVADVRIRDSKVAEIGLNLAAGADAAVIDATGTHVMPAGVDPHVHLSPFVDDFDTASQAALAGGITTFGIMSFAEAGEPIEAMLARYANEASKSLVDVVLHGVLNVEATPTRQTLQNVVDAGQTTFKIFTILGNFDRDYADYIDLLHEARARALLPFFHCEDLAVLTEATRSLKQRQRCGTGHYEQSRPVLSEELAVQKVIALCELTGCPVYIVHVSSARALAACEAAQSRGLPVFVETRPIYLHFDSRRYEGNEGALFVSFPPIRSADDGRALWRGLARGRVHTLGSDHAPLLKEQKMSAAQCCLDHPRPGMGNLQEMLPVLYAEGVVRGAITPERFVQVTSANAAKLLSLYPRKGAIAVGSDADINIWDPSHKVSIRVADGYSRADFSLFEGWAVTVPRFTLKGGSVVCKGGRVEAQVPAGAVLRRPPVLNTSTLMDG